MKTLATQGSCLGSGSEKDFRWSMTSEWTSFCLWKPASRQVKGQTCLGISPNSSNEARGCQLQRGAPVYGTHSSKGPAAPCCRCRRCHTTSSCWRGEALDPGLQGYSKGEQSRDKLNLEIGGRASSEVGPEAERTRCSAGSSQQQSFWISSTNF